MLCFWKAEDSRMTNVTFPCVNTIQLGPSPFNSSPHCKKSSLRHHFRQNSWKLGSPKLLPHGHFWWGTKFVFSLQSGPRGMFEPNSHTSNTPKSVKVGERVVLPHFCERVDESPQKEKNFGTFGIFLAFFVTEIRRSVRMSLGICPGVSSKFWRLVGSFKSR